MDSKIKINIIFFAFAPPGTKKKYIKPELTMNSTMKANCVNAIEAYQSYMRTYLSTQWGVVHMGRYMGESETMAIWKKTAQKYGVNPDCIQYVVCAGYCCDACVGEIHDSMCFARTGRIEYKFSDRLYRTYMAKKNPNKPNETNEPSSPRKTKAEPNETSEPSSPKKKKKVKVVDLTNE